MECGRQPTNALAVDDVAVLGKKSVKDGLSVLEREGETVAGNMVQ